MLKRIVMPKALIGLTILVLVCCKPRVKEKPEMTGTYRLLSQSFYDGKKDSIVAGARQLKIYVGDFMMYARYLPSDSVSSFGINSYITEPGGVKENQIVSAIADRSSTESVTFSLEIEKTETGYKQIIPNDLIGGRRFITTELYENISAPSTSRLDGSWKLARGYAVTGKDTAKSKIIEYKTYFGGHYIFGVINPDPRQKLHTVVGYGTHDIIDENRARETTEVCSYPRRVGKTYEVTFEFQGRDRYKQTIVNANGTISIEEYERIKKRR